MRHRTLLPLLCAGVLVAGCERASLDLDPRDGPTEAPLDELAISGDPDLAVAKRSADHGVAPSTHTYEITLENLTADNGGGAAQVFSPPVIATHHRSLRMWRKGKQASPELAGIAEDALNDPMVELLEGSPAVHQVQVGGGVIFPQASATYRVATVHGARRLSMAFMLVNTNDAFSGVDAVWLPWWGERSYDLYALDAGSEENTELKVHIPGPCCGDMEQSGLPTEEPIRRHRGLHGKGELDPEVYGWDGPVARLTVRRLMPRYEITLQNLTPDNGGGAAQVFSPPVIATHDRRVRMWRRGHLATEELALIAEDAINDPMVELLEGLDRVHQVSVGEGVIFPGASATYTVDAGKYRRLSMAFMLVNTNDGFSGTDALRLPRGGQMSVYLRAYDAGSEMNTELQAHIPGPCCGDMDQSGPATSERIRPHEGITGRGELSPETYGWEGPVGMLTVTRTQ